MAHATSALPASTSHETMPKASCHGTASACDGGRRALHTSKAFHAVFGYQSGSCAEASRPIRLLVDVHHPLRQQPV
eukprot:11558467-Heterocapsa_arctica.AAC.1